MSSTPGNFNPRAPRGARLAERLSSVEASTFQSTGSARSPTTRCSRIIGFRRYFNPRAPRGARPKEYFDQLFRISISIHGLREEPDVEKICNGFEHIISIHGLREEPDPILKELRGARTHFNPRAPCGARLGYRVVMWILKNFNPRAPCGARRREGSAENHAAHFNPRAPCGARPGHPPKLKLSSVFQSTGSVWSPTRGSGRLIPAVENFNPRAPCGARHSPDTLTGAEAIFQSTGSVWSPTSEGLSNSAK